MHSSIEDLRRNVVPSSGLLSLLVCLTFFLTFVGAFHDFAISTASAQEDGGLDLSVLDESAGSAATPTASPAVVDETSNNSKNSSASAASSSHLERVKLLDLVKASGWIGAILLVASVVAVTLIIRLCFLLRRSVFIPSELLQASSDALSQGDVERACEIASVSDSFFGQVLSAGLREYDRGWSATEKALEDAVASLTAKLYRRADPLSVIGNVAPMLGLLGTVMGMVSTFGELAVADASGRNLANGIYFALVTTVAGLIVAIPVLVAHSLINARVASLVSEASDAVERTLEPVKRRNADARSSEQRRPSPSSARVQTENVQGRPVRGLQELPKETNNRLEHASDGVRPPSTGRPSLSLKNRRADEE